MNHSDTIAAIATPPGRGGVGIIRISGPLVPKIAQQILGNLPRPYHAVHRLFRANDRHTLDDGIAIYFPGPNSFTGEDILELQGHGGPVVLDMVLNRCLQCGARLAKPGEFSERAFLNDKLDLTQAEAIADLIDSGSEQAARSALRSLQGEFSQAINTLLEKMIALRVYVEAALDFPDEEIDFLADERVNQRLQEIKQQLASINQKATQGSLLRDGLQLVIIGKPNAGKSSLLNALSGNETAIVTHIAGTTRDVLHESINLDGIPLHLIDTAGLRVSDDPVEKIGIERAWQAVEKADIALLLKDVTQSVDKSDDNDIITRLPRNIPLLKVHNKIDLKNDQPRMIENELYISAKHKQGIDLLKNEIKRLIGFNENTENSFIARRRHLHALEETRQHVENAEQQLLVFNAGELMAEELKQAQDYLSQITGKFTSDDLLGEIFSNFCIGK